MILVDSRIGSKQFLELLPASTSPTLAVLEFGDFAFFGNGPNDSNLYIGIERKTIPDLISSIRSGRFSAHQLPGLQENFDRFYILIEGLWKEEDGQILYMQGNSWASAKVTIGEKELINYLCSCEEFAGARLIFTKSQKHTAFRLATLYQYWQKDYDNHNSMLQLKHVEFGGQVQLIKPSLIVRVAAQLPGLGAKKARLVSPTFKTVRQLALADVSVWKSIKGIGDKLANNLVDIISKGEK